MSDNDRRGHERIDDVEVKRLLAHIASVDSRWFRVGRWLLDYGRRNVPENRDSRNPVKWLATEVACWMSDAQTWRVNRRFRDG